MENKKIKVALLGLGTVGGGVYKLIQRRSESMIHTVGAELEVEKILVHSLHKKEKVWIQSFTTDWKSIVNDPEIQIVIEVMGGIEPAKSMIEEALGAGKHVVTANKDLMAEHGGELWTLRRHMAVICCLRHRWQAPFRSSVRSNSVLPEMRSQK